MAKRMTIEERFRALNNKSQRSDNFTVEFLGLPENLSNVLGRQTTNVQRPEISFEPHETRHRGYRYQNKGKVEFEPVRLTMAADENGVIVNILYAQLFRQLNKYKDINNIQPDSNYKERDYKFDLRLRFFNSQKDMVEEYILKDCFINNVSHEEADMLDGGETAIFVGIMFDNIGVSVFDEYLEFIESQESKVSP